jgi:predicted nuclease with TOPRIM domain
MAKIDPKQSDKLYTEEQLQQIKEYAKIHARLRVLKSQMAEIQDETEDLIETLDKMRLKENKENTNGEK